MAVASIAAAHVVTVVSYAPSGRRKKAVGSAFVIRFGKHAYVVTAEHVLTQSPRPLVGIMKRASVRWPEAYKVVRPRDSSDVPDCDIAYYGGEVLASDLSGFLPTDIYPNYKFDSDHPLIAVGHPVSRAKFGADPTRLTAPNAMIVGPSVPPERLLKLGYDPRTHLGIEYDPQERVDSSGRRVVGPEPWGMSGGVLLAPIEEEVGTESRLGVMIVGVLIHYCKPPDSVLVASRIDCFLDAVFPSRPDGETLYAEHAV